MGIELSFETFRINYNEPKILLWKSIISTYNSTLKIFDDTAGAVVKRLFDPHTEQNICTADR